jgi:hypothetical protein
MTRPGLIALACLLTVLTAGCGGTHKSSSAASDQAQVSQVLESYLHAQAQGDGSTACGLLSTAGQNQLIGLVMSAGKGLITSRPSCEDAVGLVSAVAGAQLMGALDHARVEQIKISGPTATAQVVDGTAFKPQQVKLEKSDGKWEITGVPTLGA